MPVAGATRFSISEARWLPWALSALVGVAGALSLFPVAVLAGTAPFWKYPRGIFGGSWNDMATSTAGYYAYVRDVWRWPLFQTDGLGNHGINVILTDSIPIVSLLGRFLFRLTGQVVPLFGAWTGLCVVGMALASTGLVRALGARGWMPAVAAAMFGVSMPALLGRWGHVSLFAQALIPLTLTFYVRLAATPRPRAGAIVAQSMVLCVAGLMIFPYFFPMVAGLIAAGILQSATSRRLPYRDFAIVVALLVAGLCAVTMALGYWSFRTEASTAGFGYFSMNILSPLVPDGGVDIAGLHVVSDATGGQYEGAIYFGVGLLILVILCFRSLAATLIGSARRHAWLLLAVVAFTCWAASNNVFASSLLLIHVPVPGSLQHAFGIFRSSGRFAWIGLYLVTALAIAAMSRKKLGGPILLGLALVQWVQAEPVRREIRASVAGPTVPLLDRTAWEALLPTLDRLVVEPSHDCLAPGVLRLRREFASVELELMAAEAGVPTNTVYAGRATSDCSIPAGTTRSVTVYLRDAIPEMGADCRVGEVMTVCGPPSSSLPDSIATVGKVGQP